MSSQEYIELVAQLRREGMRGRFEHYPEAISQLNRGDANQKSAALALKYGLSLVTDTKPSDSWVTEIQQLIPSVDDLGRSHLAWACESVARHAVLRFDRSMLVRVIEAHQIIDAEDGALSMSKAFLGVLDFDDDALSSHTARLMAWAKQTRRPDLLASGTALLSWVAQLRSDHEEALSIARRASRMARTESIPQAEYIANIALAQARRHAGMPHLSVHILGALVRVAPPAYREWMRLELVLASGDSGPVASRDRAEGLCNAICSADSEAFSAVFASLSDHRPLCAEVLSLQKLMLGTDPSNSFTMGSTERFPNGFSLVGCKLSKHPAWVLGEPGKEGRRLLAQRALGLNVAQLGPTPRTRFRTDSTLAALLLAGPSGAVESDLFRRLYGFDFDHELHTNMFTTLLARVKERLGEHGTLRRDDRLSVQLHHPLVVPDPRCDAPDDVALLTWLGQRGGKSAKEAAAELGISVRKVQDALAKLVAEGACKMEKEGRKRTYSVDDTTFSQLTRF